MSYDLSPDEWRYFLALSRAYSTTGSTKVTELALALVPTEASDSYADLVTQLHTLRRLRQSLHSQIKSRRMLSPSANGPGAEAQFLMDKAIYITLRNYVALYARVNKQLASYWNINSWALPCTRPGLWAWYRLRANFIYIPQFAWNFEYNSHPITSQRRQISQPKTSKESKTSINKSEAN